MHARKIAAVFALLLTASASALRAEDPPALPPSRTMSDILRLSFKSGQLLLILPPADFNPLNPAEFSHALNDAAMTLRHIDGPVSLTTVGTQAFNMHHECAQGARIYADYFDYNVGRVRIERSLTPRGDAAAPIVSGHQVNLSFNAGGGDITLRIVDNNNRPQTFTATSFGQLWKEHPDEIHTYVVPLFRSLDFPGVLFVDKDDALRPFALMLKASPEIKTQVDALLPRLDADAAEVRNAAAAELAAIGPLAVPVIQEMDLKEQPLQVRVALKGFLRRTTELKEGEIDPLKNTEFLTLCLGVDDTQVPALAKAQLEKITKTPLVFDEKAPLDHRIAAMEKLRLAAIK